LNQFKPMYYSTTFLNYADLLGELNVHLTKFNLLKT